MHPKVHLKVQLRRRASAEPNSISISSEKARQKHGSDSEVVPESYQIQELLKRRNYSRRFFPRESNPAKQN